MLMPSRIAIVGAGIAGLTAAHHLGRRHDVTLFEAGSHAGGHAHTVDVELDGQSHAIDVGFVVFNERTYPQFTSLLRELNVRDRPTSMSFSVSDDAKKFEYCGSSLNGLFAQRCNLVRPGFYRMLRDILRFNREATRLAESLDAGLNRPRITVGAFLMEGRYSREFAEYYLLPMGSAIWSCPRGTFADFPLEFIVRFFRNHGLLNLVDRPTWRVIDGGSRSYVQELLRRYRGRLRLNTPIRWVRRFNDRVELVPRGEGAQSFDHVILACHSDQALSMLADPSSRERELLTSFPYVSSSAVLHTDTALLPRRRRAWASWNYRRSDSVTAAATVTYCMNILQGIESRHVFNLTLNCDHEIDSRKVLRRFEYSHPVFDSRRAEAQSRHGEVLNARRTSFCGAYWGNGFHEDGVRSALAVCQALDAQGPTTLASTRSHLAST